MEKDKISYVLDADLLTLRTLLAIVDLGSFSAAAKQVGRTQSAVSLQISKLEDRMNVRLLERTSRSVKLTHSGEIFLSYAKKIIELSDEGLAAVSITETVKPIRVGFAEYLVPKHLPNLLTRLKRSLPNIKIELKLGFGFDLYNDLSNHKLDIIIAGPEGPGGIELYSEPLVWVGAKDVLLDTAKNIEVIQMGEPCSYRKAAIESLESSGIKWSESVSINNIQGIQSAVSAGFGVSTIPKSAVNSNLEILESKLPKLPNTSINIFYNKSNTHPVTKRLIGYLKEEFKLIGLYK